LVRTLASKDCANTAWETLKATRQGCKHIREANPQTRHKEFDNLRFNPGERIEEFSIRLTSLVDDLELYGDPFNKYKAVQKFLHAVSHNYMPMVMAIEQCVNLRKLTIEDLCGCLLTTEEGYELDKVTDGIGKLLMMEEWTARHQCQHG
jgi:hypothetical protein